MKKLFAIAGIFLAATLYTTSSNAQVKTVADAASAATNQSTLVSALKAASLYETLQGEGPFTLFSPTNAAFDKLSKDSLAYFLKPENKKQLVNLLDYHVLAGSIDAEAIKNGIKENDGTAELKTVNGSTLTATMDGEKIKLTDETGRSFYVTQADIKADNGFVHVVDGVFMLK